MRRVLLVFVAFVALVGCREVRVNQVLTGTTTVSGPTQVVVVRDKRTLDALGISSTANFRKEFAVALLMGPHRETGYEQIIESIRANADRVRDRGVRARPDRRRRADRGLPDLHDLVRPQHGLPVRARTSTWSRLRRTDAPPRCVRVEFADGMRAGNRG